MTNADVHTEVAGVDGQTIGQIYDGEKRFIVPPNTPVVAFVPATMPTSSRDAVHHCGEKAGRHAERAGHQCRPRRREPADVSDRFLREELNVSKTPEVIS